MQREREGCAGRMLRVCVALICLLGTAATAQDNAPSKMEIYGGYAWMDPGAKFAGIPIGGMAKGYEIQSSYFFNKHVGITADSGASFRDRRANIGTIYGGPTVRFPMQNVTPFFHGLVGLHRVIPAAGFTSNPQDNNGVGIALGGGLDLRLNRLLSLRVLEADYIWAHHNYLRNVDTRDYQGGRIGGGLVFRFGSFGPPPPPPAASCAAQPTEVMAGEPVTVTVTPQNFNPKATLAYSWKSTGGKTSGTGATTQVDTADLAPGSYTVTANVSGGKYERQPASAMCDATFTIKAPPPKNPPTISCSANPATVRSGEPSTITCNASSPDNRPVTTAYQASAGRVTGSGNTATLDTAGAAPGPINVTGIATDDRGLSANASTTVTVSQPPPPPPQASKLNEITFKDKRRPARVDNEAKAILDDVALRLQREPDAKVVIIGHATADETTRRGRPIKGMENLAAQRAVNTKDYLVSEKGIDPNRIEVRSSTAEGNTAEIFLVPAGATFDQAGTTVVSAEIKAQPRNPRPARRKAVAKQ